MRPDPSCFKIFLNAWLPTKMLLYHWVPQCQCCPQRWTKLHQQAWTSYFARVDAKISWQACQSWSMAVNFLFCDFTFLLCFRALFHSSSLWQCAGKMRLAKYRTLKKMCQKLPWKIFFSWFVKVKWNEMCSNRLQETGVCSVLSRIDPGKWGK